LSNILVKTYRGKVAESFHTGNIAVADSAGKLLYYFGNPLLVTFMRSAAKPLQAVNVITSGAADRLNLNEQELAVMCASHYAQPNHRKTVKSILKKAGLSLNNLLCGKLISLNSEYALKLAADGVEPERIGSDCSGKHAGMLATCAHLGYSLDNYLDLDSKLQKEILHHISDFANIPAYEIIFAKDGCSAPVHAFPLFNMAISYARLANPEKMHSSHREAALRITDAMSAHPEMLAGKNGFCTDFNKVFAGRMVGKLGAEGIYCVGIRGSDLGISIKIDDGNSRALAPVVMSVLKQLDLAGQDDYKTLKKYLKPAIINTNNEKVGLIEPVFKIKKVKTN